MSAVSHIQNTAPAPPAEMAATTPTILPMPTRVAVDTMRVWIPERALGLSPTRFSRDSRNISGSIRMGTNRVRMVKNSPAGIKIATSREMPRDCPPGRGMENRSPQKKS